MAEKELKLVLEGSGSQKEAEELTEGGSSLKEGRRAPAKAAQGETVQSQRSGRKSRRGEEFTSLCCFSSSNIEWGICCVAYK